MPAALTVDQSLVDSYIERVDRFVNNVRSFEQTISDMTASFKNKFMPNAPSRETPVYQEAAAPQTEQAVVTADDIDIDALLKGMDLGNGMTI